MLPQSIEENIPPEDGFQQDKIGAFRQTVKLAREQDPLRWEATRKLVGKQRLQETRSELADRILQAELAVHVRERLLQSLGEPGSEQSSATLKQLTGLPTTKAIRALCLYFQIGQDLSEKNSEHNNDLTAPEIAAHLATNPNPYDLLLKSANPTILDLGAGDLSFEEELVDQYVPQLMVHHRPLVVHAIDRLQPGSQFGGVYHASQDRLQKLSNYTPDALQFRFWGGIDMIDSLTLHGLLPTYTLVTCHAPATPTFAYEPRRVSADVLTSHLERTKGTFRTIRVHGEEALEVHHRGKALTFPAWKFAIQGPLTLLELMARRGRMCVLSAVDNEVFWEILSQLVDDQRVRPTNVIFTPDNLPDIFGTLYQALSALKLGDRLQLGDLVALRSMLPFRLPQKPQGSYGYRFHSVQIRRGAVFHGVPASFTAHQFSHMREESPPWCLILTPQLLRER